MATFLFVLVFMPVKVCAASNDYRHLSVKMPCNFKVKELVDGKVKSSDVEARMSDIELKLDGESVRLQNEGSYGEDSTGKYVVVKSKVGYDELSSLEFGEKSTIEIFGKLSYTHEKERYSTQFHKTVQALKSNNTCKAQKGSTSYGFDLVCSKDDIQDKVNNSIINISKKWQNNKSADNTTVIVYQNDEKYETVELTKESKWGACIKGLPTGDYSSDGKWTDYKYSIKEIIPNGNEVSNISYNEKNNIYLITGKISKDAKNSDNKSEDEDVFLSDSDKKDCFNDGYNYDEEEQNDSAWLGLDDDKDVHTSYSAMSVNKVDSAPNTADTSMIYPVIIMIFASVFAMLYIWSFKKEELKVKRKNRE